ncbi:MAG: PrsW family glutamic-type intramembrane protease [Minisyncoccia bacterium]|jgi:RsiW-degrading membrane proteinase PrsW (M82 family)
MPLLVATLVFGLLPGFAWLMFYFTEEPHPEPKRLIVLTFVCGIAFGFFAIVTEQMFSHAEGQWGIEGLSLISLAGLALIEEVMKFGAAYFAVGKSPLLDEPVERMLYMVVAAMGFATLENIGAISNTSFMTSQAAFVGAFFEASSLRFVGATLLHSLTSGIVGYHWALGIARKKVGRNLTIGFVIATALHTFFNYLILNYGDITYVVVFLLIVGFFVLNDFEKLKVLPA